MTCFRPSVEMLESRDAPGSLWQPEWYPNAYNGDPFLPAYGLDTSYWADDIDFSRGWQHAEPVVYPPGTPDFGPNVFILPPPQSHPTLGGDWQILAGAWSEHNDYAVPGGTQPGDLAPVPGANNLAVDAAVNAADVTVALDVQIYPGGPLTGEGIILRENGGKGYALLLQHPITDSDTVLSQVQLSLMVYDNGVERALPEARPIVITIPGSPWYTLELTAQGSTLTAKIDGMTAYQVTNTTIAGPGVVGILAIGNSGAAAHFVAQAPGGVPIVDFVAFDRGG